MDIYFGGSIRGGRDDVELYAALIDLLDAHGTVLTEHIADEDVEGKEASADVSDAGIHDQDLAWLRQADAVVAEVSTPSLGVGYEIGRADEWEKPVLCLYRPNAKNDLSAMIRGCADANVIEYTTPADAEPEVGAFLERHQQ